MTGSLFEAAESDDKVTRALDLKQRLLDGEDVFSEFREAISALSDLEARDYAHRRVELDL